MAVRMASIGGDILSASFDQLLSGSTLENAFFGRRHYRSSKFPCYLHCSLLMWTSKRLVGPIRRLLTACDGCVLASGELFLAPSDHVCSSIKPAILTVVCHRYPRCSLGRPSTGRQ